MPPDHVQARPKILFVTSHWPFAAAYGAQQRVLNIGRLLSRIGDVSYVIVPTEQEDEETARQTQCEFDVRRVIRPVPVEPVNSFNWFVQRFRHEFDPMYMASDPYVVSAADRVIAEELIQQHDIIWVHTIRTAHWFRIYRWPHSVLDVDDLPSRTYQSSAQSASSPVRRLLDLRMSWIWRRRELTFPDRFDLLTVCSEEDRRYLGRLDRIHVIPNGAHPVAPRPHTRSALPRIGFIGNCTFKPNEDGLNWFIRDVWPKIKCEFPCTQLRLVGRGSSGYLTRTGPDIIGLGWLEDPGEEVASWSVMIIPVKVGAGTRVKTAEGFARKCPIVATSIGVFGYEVENGKEALIADSAKDFASACTLLLKNSELRESLTKTAYRSFLERWTWDSFAGTVANVVQECLVRSKG
ncbi:MAG: glycosyltransferase family 4 protein [Terracidiphilus sp.]